MGEKTLQERIFRAKTAPTALRDASEQNQSHALFLKRKSFQDVIHLRVDLKKGAILPLFCPCPLLYELLHLC